MASFDSLTTDLHQQLTILEGSLRPRYTFHYYADRQCCSVCKRIFYSVAWLAQDVDKYLYACSRDCLERGLRDRLLVRCDCCANDAFSKDALKAIVWSVPATVCSNTCLARLYHVWQPTSLGMKLYRKAKGFFRR